MPVELVSTKQLLHLVAPFAPTCPAFVAEQQIRMAAIEIAEVSRAWRHVTTVTTATANLEMAAPENTAIHEIELAEFDGVPLKPVQFSTFSDRGEGFPAYIAQSAPGSVTLTPFRAGGRLHLSLFLKPRADSLIGTNPADPFEDAYNVLPDFFVSLFGSTIAQGALARIFSIPDEPWTNPGMAGFYHGEFVRKRDAMFRAHLRGQQRAKIRTKFRDF